MSEAPEQAGLPADGVLGQSTGTLPVSGSGQVRDLALAMAGQCRRSLEIVGRGLDPPVYDNGPFCEAVKDLALASRYARVRILVTEIDGLIKRGHRLLQLADQLSSFIQIRVPSPEYRDFNEAFLVADGTGYIHRQLADRYDGLGSFADRRRCIDLLRRFDEIWERAEPDPNLRRLGI